MKATVATFCYCTFGEPSGGVDDLQLLLVGIFARLCSRELIRLVVGCCYYCS